MYGARGKESFLFLLKINKLKITDIVSPIIIAIVPFLNPRKKPIAPTIFISPPPTVSSLKKTERIKGIGKNNSPVID
nr:hypothetical protein [Xylanivirga thermophila]